MAFKRALWSSGYTYQISCPNCGTTFFYTDRQLDFRPWFPNGFVYCQRCRKPLRHSEIFAIRPDGTPVYNSIAEAEQAINNGYLNARGVPQPPMQPMQQPGQPPMQQPMQQPMQPPMQPPVQQPAPQAGEACCPQCGRSYVPGRDHFCSGCGKKLD